MPATMQSLEIEDVVSALEKLIVWGGQGDRHMKRCCQLTR